MDSKGDIYEPCPGVASWSAPTHVKENKQTKKKNSVRVAGNLTKSLTKLL